MDILLFLYYFIGFDRNDLVSFSVIKYWVEFMVDIDDNLTSSGGFVRT